MLHCDICLKFKVDILFVCYQLNMDNNENISILQFFRQIVASVFRPTLIKVEAWDRDDFTILHFYSDDQTTTLCISERGRGKKLEDSEG